MFLLIGLGNPSSSYARNRHNIGFMALDALAESALWREKFQGLYAERVINGEKVLLLKPQTYMNLSGQSVAAAQKFYKIDLGRIIVFHDELDLPFGKIRVKQGGGDAGHNGLRSITAHCGADYKRVRLGIGHPGDKALVHSYVLSDFAKSEESGVANLCRACAAHMPILLDGKDSQFQNKVLGDCIDTQTLKH